MKKTIGFIGAGNMGGAIIKGIIKNGAADAKDVFVYDKNTSAVNALAEEYGIVNAETAKLAKDAGVDMVVSGSYVCKSMNYNERIDSLRN